MNNFDAIVVGAGHNGLVTAGYLAKAGLRVAVFEKRKIEGGCAVTEEVWPGFQISRLSYVNSLFRPQIVQDLELVRHGFEMLPRNPSSFTPYPDGRSLLLGPDRVSNQKEIAKFSKWDAERYPQYEETLTEIATLLEPIMKMIPLNPSKLSFGDFMDYGKIGFKNRAFLKRKWPEIMRFMTSSANDLLDEWFESDELKSTLATDAVIGANASSSTPGTGYVLFHHVMGECNGVRGVWGYMRGGMGGLTQSLAKSCRNLGVGVYTGCGVSKIITQGGAARGVLLEDGREFHAKIIVSNADPNVTFNRLVGAEHLPEEFVQSVRRINYDSAAIKMNLALSEVPDFKALPGKTPGPQHRGTIHICPSTQYIEEAYADSVAGRPSQNPILECSIPTSLDETIAPPGKHVMNIFTQYAPYKLKTGKTWDQEKESYGKRCIEILCEYAPNIKNAILHYEVLTPLDMEREWSITGGNIHHGRLTLDQMFSMRPVPGYADYRSPIAGLYLCGAGTHPGGGVMGIPGMNAAQQVLKDKIWK